MSSIVTQIEERIKTFGFADFGWVRLDKPLSLDIYKQWIDEGHHGEMGYLKDHINAKENPNLILPKAKSALVLSHNYYPHPKPFDNPLKEARVALYAQGYDYHYWLREKLLKLCETLKEIYPSEEFLCFTDSAPIMERDLAYRAGLGWVGKNSCLIHSQIGSLFFIGEIYTTLNISETVTADVHPDRCGNCTKCIDACPTNAITSPKKIEADKCISYLNIEAKSNPKKDLRPLMNDWFFGCDICQTVCPWNGKVFGKELMAEKSDPILESEEGLIQDLKWILGSSNKSLQKVFHGTGLSRATGNQLKRNAIVVAANKKLSKLTPEIEAYLGHEKLAELATWALNQLKED